MGLFSRKASPPAAAPQGAAPELHQTLSARPTSAAEQGSSLERQSVGAGDGNSYREPEAPSEPLSAGSPEASTAPSEEPEERLNFVERRLGRKVDWLGVRISVMFCFFVVCMLVLWGRAWHLQMMRGPALAEYARHQHITSEMVAGKRGMIMDRDGQVLARSVEVLSIYANPRKIGDPLMTANTLGPILGREPQELYDELTRTRKQFLWLKRKVDDYTADAVRAARLPGVGLSKEYDRVYPFKHMAGQLLGFVGFEDKGLEGLERSLDRRLASESTRQTVLRDATGRRFYMREEGQEDPHGEDIRLTIDAQMQFFAEEAVSRVVREERARGGGALVVPVPTGDILAWAQAPFFNPNDFKNSRPAVYRNRLAQDALEPGSTFKPLVVAAAMQERRVSRDTVIDCEGGRWRTKYTTLRDTSSRGKIPVHKVIRYSSNIGMAKIGLMLGNQTFHRYLTSLGFGERTNVPVAENRGILRNPKDWNEVDCMSTSFGQSVSVTPLQLAQAYLALLNNGVRKDLRLLKDEPPSSGRQQIFSGAVAQDVRRMMREVVEESDGTGRRAAIDGVAVGGKTGTAQKADTRAGSYGSKRLASFVGFFPVEKPVYLILVFVDEPQITQYGGVIAAPAFREIAQRTLAYAGMLDGTRLASKEAGAPAEAGERQRGMRLSELDCPFVARAQAERGPAAPAARPRVRAARPQEGEGMRLPGYLARASATVPDVQGKTLRYAVELFARAGIVPELKGEGMRVVRQSPPPGSPWPEGGEERPRYTLWLSER